MLQNVTWAMLQCTKHCKIKFHLAPVQWMWKTSLPKSVIYFRRTFPSQRTTKLRSFVSPSCLSPSASFFLSPFLFLHPSSTSLFPKVKLIFPSVAAWVQISILVGKWELPFYTHSWAQKADQRKMILFFGVGGRKLTFQSIFLLRKSYNRTHHKLMLYLSNLLSHQSHLYLMIFSELSAIRCWLTLRDIKGRKDHWTVKIMASTSQSSQILRPNVR